MKKKRKETIARTKNVKISSVEAGFARDSSARRPRGRPAPSHNTSRAERLPERSVDMRAHEPERSRHFSSGERKAGRAHVSRRVGIPHRCRVAEGLEDGVQREQRPRHARRVRVEDGARAEGDATPAAQGPGRLEFVHVGVNLRVLASGGDGPRIPRGSEGSRCARAFRGSGRLEKGLVGDGGAGWERLRAHKARGGIDGFGTHDIGRV
jgi:hypothetical protein